MQELSKTDGWSPSDPAPGERQQAGRVPKSHIQPWEKNLFHELSKTDGWDPSETVYGAEELGAVRQMAGVAAPKVKPPTKAEMDLYRELSKSDNWDPDEVVIPARR